MNKLKAVYQHTVDHLTKYLGAAGASFLSILGFFDPHALRDDIVTFFGQHAAEKVGAFLFTLVILRGWYTGRKAKQLAGQ